MKFAWRLAQRVETNGLGRIYAVETGFEIHSDPDTVRAPDAAFVSRERLEEVGPVEGYRPGAPDLAAEVVSPNDRHSEVIEKVREWLDAGCPMVLVVDPKQHTATVYRSREDIRILAEGDAPDGDGVIPGFSPSVTENFA